MAKSNRDKQNKEQQQQQQQQQEKDRDRLSRRAVGSTTSLGKRRSRRHQDGKSRAGKETPSSPATNTQANKQLQSPQAGRVVGAASDSGISTMSNPKSSEYGSQASPMRVPLKPTELTKVAILGAAGGIGQPLALLLMLHSEYVHHLALHDLVPSLRGVGLDLSHVDRQCKITTHVGSDELADAVRGAKVIVIPAGLAQRPGMSRDDLFGSNAKIMYNLAKVCAQAAPEAMLAIISNPVNSLVPLTCEVYRSVANDTRRSNELQHHQPAATTRQQQQSPGGTPPAAAAAAAATKEQQELDQETTKDAPAQQQAAAATTTTKSVRSEGGSSKHNFLDCFRRIFGVTTLDVVRASTLTAKSAFFKAEPNGLFRDPAKIQIPVIGGHAGKTIMPILSQAVPKLDKKRLLEDKATTSTVIESIQEAGIDVLNNKKGKGSATLAMAYSACRFTISLLRAQLGEPNIVECAYVRHQSPVYSDLDYFAAPVLLGKNGYVKSFGIGKLLPFEHQMLEEAARELRSSIAKGEDFARENLTSEK